MNVKTIIDEWSVKDLEDNTSLSIKIYGCTQMGNQSRPGIQVRYMGKMVNFEPLTVERWLYKASKTNQTEMLLSRHSWTIHEDRYVKVSLLTNTPLKAKIEVKTRSSQPKIKEYELPFTIE
ncbi:hypothetical protein [Aquimarina algiphila]|uniref:hypothetical protein n=1 Tax=Aquimarina algiphila TaxID=2047982 RepID=UPI00232F24D8|nr:hypothetical protein [Aquimarina algiphila]